MLSFTYVNWEGGWAGLIDSRVSWRDACLEVTELSQLLWL